MDNSIKTKKFKCLFCGNIIDINYKAHNFIRGECRNCPLLVSYWVDFDLSIKKYG